MDYCQLGCSGLKVSPNCRGTMMFGGATDEPTSAVIIDKARAAGINFIDIADACSDGGSKQAHGITAGPFAMSWVLNSPLVDSVLAGPRTEQQRDDYMTALDDRFTREDEALIDRLVASGHPSTPGYNDPACSIEGRRPRTASPA